MPFEQYRYAFYTWLTPLLQKGYKNQLHPEDMVGLIPRMRSKQLGERLENSYIMYKRPVEIRVTTNQPTNENLLEDSAGLLRPPLLPSSGLSAMQ